MTALQAPLLTYVAIAAGIGSVWLIVHETWLRYRRQVRSRLTEEFGDGEQKVARTTLFKDLSRLSREVDVEYESLAARWERIIDQADLALNPRQLLLVGPIIGAALSLAAVLLAGTAAVAAVTFPLGASLPFLYVLLKRNQRIETLRRQLPDAFEIMSRSIRAGQTVQRAFQVVSDDFDPPLGDEFGWCYEQQNLGLPPDVALRDLARRTGVAELQMLVVALLVQRQSGGSPVELLENLGQVVRKRNKLREKVKALTAEGRMQAMVLLCIPPGVLTIISVTNPDYCASLWAQPWLLAGMAGSELIGALWIRRIITFRY